MPRQLVPRASFLVCCAKEVFSSCIVVCTEAGGMARYIAKYRPTSMILAGSRNTGALKQLMLTYGVIPQLIDGVSSSGDVQVIQRACARGMLQGKSKVIVASGQVDGFHEGTSTFMQVVDVDGDYCANVYA